MKTVGEAVAWLGSAATWQGEAGIVHRLAEHVWLSAVVVLAAGAVAVPLGVWLGHLGRGAAVVLNVANVGRAVPSIALLVLGVQVWGIGIRPAFAALTALAVPPILTNAYVGVRGVDADVVDAARGMGMPPSAVLWRVEMPLAAPLLLAGIRIAAVQVVATATLAALVAWGGLGRFIVDGLAQRDFAQLVGGAALVAALALATEGTLALVERRVVPAPFRHATGRREAAVDALTG